MDIHNPIIGRTLPILNRYFLAIGIFIAALGLRFLMLPVDAGLAFLFFYPGTAIAALFCGLLPTLLYILLAAVTGAYVFFPPFWAFSENTIVPTVAFIVSAITILLIVIYYQSRVARQTQMLQRENEKNLALLHNASDGIHILDTDGNVIEASDSFCSMLGYKRDEIIGMNVSQWDAKLTETALPQAISAQFAQKGRSQFETRHRRKDGTSFDVEISGFPLELEGKPVLFNSSRDITERKKQEWQLKQMSYALSNVKESVFLVNEEGYIQYVNDEVSRVLGYTKEELLGGMSVPDISAVMTKESWEEHWQSIKTHGSVLFESKQRTKDGHVLPVEVSANYFDYDGTGFTIGLVRDLSNHNRADAEERIAATIFKSQEGMLVTDANSVILRVNSAFTDITGYTAEEVVGKTPRILSSGRHDAAFYSSMWENITSTGSWDGEIWNRRKNGEVYPEYLTITAVKNQAGDLTNYVATLTDITMSKKAADEIKNLAFYDPLTRLPNRRLLLDRLQQALASGTRSGRTGALLFIDLDNFKTLNDTLGHDMGDMLLQQVAQRLTSCVREGDTVARFGGDEFVVMLEDLSEHALDAASHTEAVGNKILFTLNQSYQLADHEYRNSSSIGATLFSGNSQTIGELMKQADIAMYQAKKAGRNTLQFFDMEMQHLTDARMSLEAELRKAIDDHQFHLYYQIQVDLTQRPLGAEALIRWIHPERGLISPADFIPIAEEMGLIHTIGWWVLKTACAQIKAWQNEPRTSNLILSVNVSAKQFHQANFADQVKTAMQFYDTNPKLLKLELTEGMLLESLETTITTMYALRDIGVGFSLDDFGTGYSSLQYLKRLPLTQLKIDQSFVRDIAVDNSDQAIVRTIIAMAHSLNLDVIAEGVETEDQRQYLEEAGCIHFQGYLFGKPVPIEQFEVSLKQG